MSILISFADLPSIDVHRLVTVTGGLFQGQPPSEGVVDPSRLGPTTSTPQTPPNLRPEGDVRSFVPPVSSGI